LKPAKLSRKLYSTIPRVVHVAARSLCKQIDNIAALSLPLHLQSALAVFSHFPRDMQRISLAVNLPDVTYEQPVSRFDTRVIYPLSRKRSLATERYDCNNEHNYSLLYIVRRQRNARVNQCGYSWCTYNRSFCFYKSLQFLIE